MRGGPKAIMDGFHLYQAIGGTATCRKLSAAFYARVERDPVLRPLFPGEGCLDEEYDTGSR